MPIMTVSQRASTLAAGRLPLNASAPPGATHHGATMNDIARQLRAQIPSSTDPDRLEQMAREAEGRTSPLRTQCVDSRGSESECPEYPEWVKPDARRLRPSCAADAQEEFHVNEGKQPRGFPARLQQLSARSPELRRI